MGIKDLLPLIRSECVENQIVTYTFDDLFGSRIAIDISIFLYRYSRSAGPVRWVDPFLILLCTLRKYGIKAVCIFDGPNPPKEKQQEQERRRRERETTISRMERCRKVRAVINKDYLPTHLPLDEKLKEECKLLICPRRSRKPDITNYDSPSDVMESLDRVIDRLDKNTQPVTKEMVKMAMKLVKLLGLACYMADGEAETLCAYLAVKGKVDAVLTEDTDVLAYGTPLMLRFGQTYSISDKKLEGIHLPSVLDDLRMSQEEFRDLCILLTCDYNKREPDEEKLKGYPPDGKKRKKPIGIGPKGAYLMIEEYRRLEEVSNHLMNSDLLKFRRCRELFTIPNDVSIDMVPMNKPVNTKRLAKFLEEYQVPINMEYIMNCCKPVEILLDGESQTDFIE